MTHVLTLGTFDLFHRGHVRLLARAAELGTVTVALNTDKFITHFKGRPPEMTYQERYEVVAACRYVEHVVANAEDGNSRRVIADTKPYFIVIGDDWLERDYLGQLQIDREFLAKHNIAVLFVPHTAKMSSTTMRKRCLDSFASQSSEPSTAATRTRSLSSIASTLKAAADPTSAGSSVKPEKTPATSGGLSVPWEPVRRD